MIDDSYDLLCRAALAFRLGGSSRELLGRAAIVFVADLVRETGERGTAAMATFVESLTVNLKPIGPEDDA